MLPDAFVTYVPDRTRKRVEATVTELDLLDPEECPFTEAEIVAAARLWPEPAERDALVQSIITGVREAYADRVRALAALARGSREVDEINYGIVIFPYEIFGLVAALSPAHADRVEIWRANRRAARRSQRVAQAMWNAGCNPRDAATPAVLAQIDAEDRDWDEQWKAMRALPETMRKNPSRDSAAAEAT
jgi:hypothetical protein